MGCDVFYEGSLPDERLQVKVLRFVLSSYEKIALSVKPIPDKKYLTTLDSGKPPVEYPFDFFGVIPFYEDELVEHRQFVFDRTAGGKLIRFVKLPKEFNLPPFDKHYEREKSEVMLRDGGYTREIGGEIPFSLSLNIIRLRWWPEMVVADDYDVGREVSNILRESGLQAIVKNENFDFPASWRMFKAEYEIRHPRCEPEPKRTLQVVPPNAEKMSIEYLDLSSLTIRSLKRAKIRTVGNLIAFSQGDLLKIKNMGHWKVNEILEALQEIGLHLRPEKK